MKKRKFMLPFFTLLLFIIIAATVFILLIKNTNKVNQDAVDTSAYLTPLPTQAVTPTVTPLPTQVPVKTTELYPAYEVVNDQKLYGYINKTGSFVIPPSFDVANDFSDGVANVTIEGKNCVIDEKGSILYNGEATISDFHNGLASFYTWNDDNISSYGYMDTTGTVVIDAKYTAASDFNKDGTAYVSTGDGKYALIDKTGKELETYEIDKKYNNPYYIQDGYLLYSNADSFKYGVINMKGEEIFKPIYSEITYLEEGLFAVKSPDLDDYDKIMAAKQAIFNQDGEQLTDYIYYDISSYKNDYCSASDETSTFFVGLDGKEATNLPKFDGGGTLKLFGDVVSAYIDDEQFYCNLDGSIFWQQPSFYKLSDTLKVNKIKYRPNRYVLVNYPQLEGLSDASIQKQINDQLKSLFTDARALITEADLLTTDDSFNAKLMNNLLIVERDGYDYTLGAAHGMPIKDFFYIDLTTGTFYQLQDLFKADSDYTTKINEMIQAEITANTNSGDAMYLPDSFTGIDPNQSFMLAVDSLIIYFYPYDIAAFAAGFPEFTIPFEDIMDNIDTEGAFWKSFHGAK